MTVSAEFQEQFRDTYGHSMKPSNIKELNDNE